MCTLVKHLNKLVHDTAIFAGQQFFWFSSFSVTTATDCVDAIRKP